MNILITSAGRRVTLVSSFQAEARNIEPKSKIFAVDLEPEISAACRISDQAFKAPEVTEKSYIPMLIDLCVTNEIDMLIPTIDPELPMLAKHRQELRQEGINVVVSDLELVESCQDKRKTIDFFQSMGIQTPQLIDKHHPIYPMYAKPFDGSSSKHNYIIKDASALRDYHLNNEKLMFFEYLDHETHDEYTLDLYYDQHSELKCVVPRKRIEVREGEVNKGLTENNVLVPFVKKKLARIDGARGCLTLQLFLNRNTGSIHGIELNPRFGGGYPLSYLAGANFPRWLIKEYLFGESPEFYDDWEENLLMLRYDKEVLVHDFHHIQSHKHFRKNSYKEKKT